MTKWSIAYRLNITGLYAIDQRRLKMEDIRLGIVEEEFANIIWENEPLSSGDLVKLCQEKLEWKKSTTYTVLKKLCERGIFKNENSIVSSIIPKAEYYAIKSESFVDATFEGSLPAFIAAFTKRKKLSEEEIIQIKSIIDKYGEE